MKVYILTMTNPNQNPEFEIMGIFGSKQDAQNELENLVNDENSYDCEFEIQEHEVF